MPELSQRFIDRADSIFDNTKRRTREKRNKHQRVIRRGQDLPFSRQEFRAWLLAQFAGNEYGVIRCCYCNRPVDVYSCRVDHATPLHRGGNAGFENLALPCDVCNSIKSRLLPDEFRWFLDRMAEMSLKFGQTPVRDIMSRLEKAVALAQSVRMNRVRRVQEQAAAVAVPAVDDDF